jgi:N-acetylglucosaminyldiphosphoundecaprenol N-acetyl-beta-D-mannosaminyltransferase
MRLTQPDLYPDLTTHEVDLALAFAQKQPSGVNDTAHRAAIRPGSDDGPWTPPPRMRLMDVSIGAVTEAYAVWEVIDAAIAERGTWVITANLDHIRRYQSEALARELMDGADLVVADGTPLVWASRLAGTPLPQRVAGSNMIWSICEAASRLRQSVFLLGGDPGVAGRAAAVLTHRYQDLQIAGISCPPFGFEHNKHERKRIEREILKAAPQIVFVALGFPKQDILIRDLRRALPHASFLGVGISLSYVTGDVSRAPAWSQRLGLEWAYRLSQEPVRLARRYLRDGLPFAVRLLAVATRQRLQLSGRDASWGWDGHSETTEACSPQAAVDDCDNVSVH